MKKIFIIFVLCSFFLSFAKNMRSYIKKILGRIILIALFFFSLAHAKYAIAAEPCAEGATKCVLGSYSKCESGVWVFKYNCSCGCANAYVCKTGCCTPKGGTCSSSTSCCNPYICDETGHCAIQQPTTSPPTATPTPLVCDTTPGGCYPLADDGCYSTCRVCPPGYIGPGTKDGDCYSSSACRSLFQGPCYEYFNLEDSFFCGWCTGGTPMPTPTPFCQPFRCYNIPPLNSVCPGFNPAGVCPSDLGNCDNCGGMNCGLCPGSVPPVGPTPTPGCTENCLSDLRYPTTCYNQTFGICGDTIWCYGSVYPNCGAECSGHAIGTTYPALNGCGTCDGCNNAPTFLSLVIKNADGNVVAGESGGTTLRNHICQTTFQNSSSSKKVIFEASVNDLDGATDIDTATLTWNGRNYSMTKGYSSGTGATMVVTVDYSIFSATVTDVYDLFVTVTDIYDASSGSVDTDRDWKVWDCYIPTSGTLYNGSAGQACFTGLGFSVPIDVGVSFDSLIFNNNNVSVRVFTVSKPSNYGGNYIVWGEIYHPRINKGTLYNENGDLLATGRVTRITDLGAGTAAQCPSNEFVIGNGIQALISAYSVNPEAQIDFSFIRDQEAWYQVVGAGVKSRNRLEYGVPVTAPLESKFLTLSSATNGNGLVSATDFNNINGNNNNEFGSPNNWYVLRNTNDLDIYNYNYFYNNFFVKAGVGVTGTDWAGKPENGIYLVKNSLNITSDFVLVDTTKTMMVIVNGDITIQPNVTRLDGIYIADGSINVGGISDNQLNINGMLYAGSDVKLYRSFTDKTDNNTTPAVKVNYSPGLIFNLPPEILRGLSGWREE